MRDKKPAKGFPAKGFVRFVLRAKLRNVLNCVTGEHRVEKSRKSSHGSGNTTGMNKQDA
jgi:hypothetical protein